MAEAEDPGFLGLDEVALIGREAGRTGEEGREPAAGIQPGEGLGVHPHLGAIKDLAVAPPRADLYPYRDNLRCASQWGQY